MIRIIFASSFFRLRYVIGKKGVEPWRGLVPSDLRRFKILTKKQSVVMGRKTWDSIPEKFRPFDKNLPLEESRQTIVITRNQDFIIDNPRVVIAHSLEEAVQIAKSGNVWVIGGAEIYALALPEADFIHWTRIHRQFCGDTFFPLFNLNQWRKISEEHCAAGVSGTEKEKDRIDSSYYIFQHIW